MKQCERCLKLTDGIHTCTPTDFVRKLELERDKYRKALEYVRLEYNLSGDEVINEALK